MARFASGVLILFFCALATTASPAPLNKAEIIEKAQSQQCNELREEWWYTRQFVLDSLPHLNESLKIPGFGDEKVLKAIETVKSAFKTIDTCISQRDDAFKIGEKGSESTEAEMKKAWDDAKSALDTLDSDDDKVISSRKLLEDAYKFDQWHKESCSGQA